jgi:hypothetical protein
MSTLLLLTRYLYLLSSSTVLSDTKSCLTANPFHYSTNSLQREVVEEVTNFKQDPLKTNNTLKLITI